MSAMGKSKAPELLQGLIFGILFGFLLHKGGATKFDVIIGQLLLTDFTVLKIMLSAVVVGMLGVHAMNSLGWVELKPKSGSVGKNVVGGLIFGIGFAVLGYCPGTIAGAIGNGYLDATIGGVAGILIGAGIFAALFPRLNRGILSKGDFGDLTLPRLLKINTWLVVLPLGAIIVGLLVLLEWMNL